MNERQTEQPTQQPTTRPSQRYIAPKMGLFAQFMEYFFGVSWVAKEVPPEPLAPLCSACHNRAERSEEGGPWRCPHHPRAALLDPPKQGEGEGA
jgi:hypothetical protein